MPFLKLRMWYVATHSDCDPCLACANVRRSDEAEPGSVVRTILRGDRILRLSTRAMLYPLACRLQRIRHAVRDVSIVLIH